MDCGALPQRPEELERILVEAATIANATVVQTCFHQFSPHGLSGVVVIAESHLAAHTWPEHHAVCIDLFSCSEKMNSQAAIDYLGQQFQAKDVRSQLIRRGMPNP